MGMPIFLFPQNISIVLPSTPFFQRDDVFYLLCTRASMVWPLRNIQRRLWHLGWYICLSVCVYVVNGITTPCLEISNSRLVWHDITMKFRSKRGPRPQRQFAFPHMGSPRKLASLGGSAATTIQYRPHVYVPIILCGTIAQLKTTMSRSCLAIYLHLMRSLFATQLAPVDWMHCYLENSLFFCFNNCYQSLCCLFSVFNSCVLDYMSAIGGETCCSCTGGLAARISLLLLLLPASHCRKNWSVHERKKHTYYLSV